MSQNLKNWYAVIDLTTGECLRVETQSEDVDVEQNPDYIQIDRYIPEYEGKYYLNGQWYEDAEGTIPWSPEA